MASARYGLVSRVPFVFLIHLAATWALVGLIWFVQIVHYPLFGYVGGSDFPDYEAQHTRRTGWLVGVLMPLEAVTGVSLVIATPADSAAIWPVVGLVLIAALWLTTLTVHVPMHRRLASGFATDLGNRLVVTNWIRTLLWSARGVLVLSVGGWLIG